MGNAHFGTDGFITKERQNKNFTMDDKLKADINKIVDEEVSSRLSNQQATLTFNLENIDAEDRLKKMLNVDKYDMALYDFSQFLRKFLKYGEGEKVRFKSYDEYKEIVPDYNTMEYVKEMFYDCLENNKINLDD
ncbi:MAG: hypothetical protein ACK5KT_10285 [Dysgonomonas sp.]